MPVVIDDHAFAASINPKCRKLLKPLRGKEVDLAATCSRDTNGLLKALQCDSKATKTCADTLAAYMQCHGSIMGTGSFQGQMHCGLEMAKLLGCLSGGAAS